MRRIQCPLLIRARGRNHAPPIMGRIGSTLRQDRHRAWLFRQQMLYTNFGISTVLPAICVSICRDAAPAACTSMKVNVGVISGGGKRSMSRLPTQRRRVEERLAALDADGDGNISGEELVCQLCTSCGVDSGKAAC